MNPLAYNILDLIPQRPPMVMIDALTRADERMACGSLFITASNMFCENGKFAEPGLIEFIAQSAAAYTGFKNKTASTGVTEGYIGAIKNLVIYDLPAAVSTIVSEIIVENEIVGYTIITGRVYFGNKLMAECEMRILGG